MLILRLCFGMAGGRGPVIGPGYDKGIRSSSGMAWPSTQGDAIAGMSPSN